MLKKIIIRFFCIFVLSLSGSLGFALEPNSFFEDEKDNDAAQVPLLIQKIPELDLELIHLKNGMRVCLKRINSDDEISVRLMAMGGVASLPLSQKASGELSRSVTLRSGLGAYSFDQLHALLYEHSIEFNSAIKPFSRTIEGSAHQSRIETLFHLIHLHFTQHRHCIHCYHKVLERERRKLENRSQETPQHFEQISLSFNSQNFYPLLPSTVADLDKADFHDAKNFFTRCFSDPSHFICIVVGPFDTNTMHTHVIKHLSTIPENHQKPLEILEPLPLMLKDVQVKTIDHHFNRVTAMTKITFPLQVEVTESMIDVVECMTTLMQDKCNGKIASQVSDDVKIQVAIQLPLYPFLEMPWLTIQYASDPTLVDSINQLIFSELKILQEKSIDMEEIARIRKDSEMTTRLKDSSFWLKTLSNYLLWQWDLRKLQSERQVAVEPDQIKKGLNTFFSLEHYTILSSHPS